MRRTRLLCLSKFLLVAMLFAALAPAVSRTLAAQTGDSSQWQLICGSDGLRWIYLAEDGQTTPPANGENMLMVDCALCLLSLREAILPPAALAPLVAHWRLEYSLPLAPPLPTLAKTGVYHLTPPAQAPPLRVRA